MFFLFRSYVACGCVISVFDYVRENIAFELQPTITALEFIIAELLVDSELQHIRNVTTAPRKIVYESIGIIKSFKFHLSKISIACRS